MPQQKGEVPAKLARRLEAAREAFRAADAERDAAVLAALRAGGSYREIARFIGLSVPTVARIGERHGWPDQKELDRRAAVDAERHRFDHLFP